MTERKIKNTAGIKTAKMIVAGTEMPAMAETAKEAKGEKKKEKSARSLTETESAKTKAAGERKTEKKKESAGNADLGEMRVCGDGGLEEGKNTDIGGGDGKNERNNTENGVYVGDFGTVGMKKCTAVVDKGVGGMMEFHNSAVGEDGGALLSNEIVGEGGSVMEAQKNMSGESGSFMALEKNISGSEGVGSLAGYMTQLLQMPAEEEKCEVLLPSGYRGGEVNQALLLAQSVLDKAIEKGDIAAFKAVKAMMEEEGSESSQLERIVRAIASNMREMAEGAKATDKSKSEVLGQEPE